METVVDDGLAVLTLDDDEDSEIQIENNTETVGISFDLCFVGRFVTSSVIHFQSMRNTLANLWRPLGGIAISDLGNNRYLYRFYHKVDLERVYAGGPWHFNSHLLLLHKLEKGEDPMVVSLNTSPFWVLVRDVPHGYMLEHFAKVLGNFIGEFMEYDAAAISLGYKGTMRIQASFDIRKPLKRRKKVALNNGGYVYVRFEYEKLQLFCFICGRIGHGESLCPI
ncbi:hypothetical protein like AT3G31430 [Hibiscus trionum]|uniref:CCHC-type domain-containing protein n=1 Tax=Hibiscus trionum TaxID=183268 RepID=A0A9W7MF05_HIBTR|nr:hypothetical protein like AT3G31430 [Hibiscus trionum]